MTRLWRGVIVGVLLIASILVAVAMTQLPAIGAGALLHPARRPLTVATPTQCDDVTFMGVETRLTGWSCHTQLPRRATIVFLHGVADNRASATGIIERFLPRGFDVVAYDSRAHGRSDGEVCTYGFYEKQDLRRVIDAIGSGPIVLIGDSLGAAVALQEAATDRRVTTLVAAESFSDLRTVASERAPKFFTTGIIQRAFDLAEREGRFSVNEVSPRTAAKTIAAAVLLVHGGADVDTPPDHSRRIYDALTGPKRLIIVPGAHHNEALTASVWDEIDAWIETTVVAARPVA